MSGSGAIGFFQIGQSGIGNSFSNMAGPISGTYQTISATGTFAGLYLPDWQQSPLNLSYAVEVPAGVTTSFSVSYTLDDIEDLTWTPVWFADPANGSATIVTAGGSYSTPIRGLSVAVTALSGGIIRFAVLQGISAR